jgi:hypothetical protein
MAQYDRLSDQLLNTGHGGARLSSHFVLARCKQSDGYPIESLLRSSQKE